MHYNQAVPPNFHVLKCLIQILFIYIIYKNKYYNLYIYIITNNIFLTVCMRNINHSEATSEAKGSVTSNFSKISVIFNLGCNENYMLSIPLVVLYLG